MHVKAATRTPQMQPHPEVVSSSCTDLLLRVAKFVLNVFLTFTLITPFVLGIYELFRSRAIENLHREQDSLLRRICYALLIVPALSLGVEEIWSAYATRFFETVSVEEAQKFSLEKLPPKPLTILASRKEIVEGLDNEQFVDLLFRSEIDKKSLLLFLPYRRSKEIVSCLNAEQVTNLLKNRLARESVIALLSSDQVDTYIEGIIQAGHEKKLVTDFQIPLFLNLVKRANNIAVVFLVDNLLKKNPSVMEKLIGEERFISCLNNYHLSSVLKSKKLDLEKRRAATAHLTYGQLRDPSLFATFCEIHIERMYLIDQEVDSGHLSSTQREQCSDEMKECRQIFATFTEEQINAYIRTAGLDQIFFLFLSKKQLDKLEWKKLQFSLMTPTYREGLSIYKERVKPSLWLCSWRYSVFLEDAKLRFEEIEDDELYKIYHRAHGLINRYMPTMFGYRYEQMVKKDGQSFVDGILDVARRRSMKTEKSAPKAIEDKVPVLLTEEEAKAFQTLGMCKENIWEEVKQKFRKLALKNHKDKADDPAKEEFLKEVILAFKVLQNHYMAR